MDCLLCQVRQNSHSYVSEEMMNKPFQLNGMAASSKVTAQLFGICKGEKARLNVIYMYTVCMYLMAVQHI